MASLVFGGVLLSSHSAQVGLFMFRALRFLLIDDLHPYTCSYPAEKISLDQHVFAGHLS